MSFTDKRELEIDDPAGGGSITFERDGSTVRITRTVFYTNHAGEQPPIELDTSDRRALMDFLNLGEYRRLSYEEGR
jgi:hypothetical protein